MDKQLIRFKYNNKIYQTGNLDNMLSRLGITASDIKLIEEPDVTYVPKNLFYFKNRINGHSITSINNSLDDLKELININDWYRVDVL